MSVTTKAIAGLPVLVALLGVTFTASAQETKVGVVSWQRLLTESPTAKTAEKRLEEEFASRRQGIMDGEKEFRDLTERLETDQAVMSEEQKQQAESDLREKQRELSRSQRQFLEDLNLRRNEEMSALNGELLQHIQSYARGAGFDLIIGDGVLFASESIDITDQILAGLQE
ncbi:MAG: OmpH family outer membrane protein [Gammaproteobacteria bacterium]